MSNKIRGSVLITRPLNEAYDVADLLEEKGFHAICEPFLKIHHLDFKIDIKRSYKAVILTSLNAVQALLSIDLDPSKIVVFTVGERTSKAVKEAGYKNVISAGGTVDDLVEEVKRKGLEGPYLYLRGKYISKDIKALLPEFQIDEAIVYETTKIQHVAPWIEQVIMRGELSAVLFYSARTAQSFCEWVKGHPYADNVAAGLKRSRALCLGPSMVECLSDMPWKDVQVAQAPNNMSLMALLMDK